MPGQAPDYRTGPRAGGGSNSITVGGRSRTTDQVQAMTAMMHAQQAMYATILPLAQAEGNIRDQQRTTSATRRERLQQAIAAGDIKGVEGGQVIESGTEGLIFEDDAKATEFWRDVSETTAKGNMDRTRKVRNEARERIMDQYQNVVNDFINIQDTLKLNGVPIGAGTQEAFTNILSSANFGNLLYNETDLQLIPGRDGSNGVIDFQVETDEQKKALETVANRIIAGDVDRWAQFGDVNVGDFKKLSEYFKNSTNAGQSLELSEDYGSLRWNPSVERDVDRDSQYLDEIKTSQDRLNASVALADITGILGAGSGRERPFDVNDAAMMAARQRHELNMQDTNLRSRLYQDSQTVRAGSVSNDFGNVLADVAARYGQSVAAGVADSYARFHAPMAGSQPPNQNMSVVYSWTGKVIDKGGGQFENEHNNTGVPVRQNQRGQEFTGTASSYGTPTLDNDLVRYAGGDWNNVNGAKVQQYFQHLVDNSPTLQADGYRFTRTGNTVSVFMNNRPIGDIILRTDDRGGTAGYRGYQTQKSPIEVRARRGSYVHEWNTLIQNIFPPN